MLKGVAASPGIAIGKAFLLEEEEFVILRKEMGRKKIRDEKERFRRAVSELKEDMQRTKERAIEKTGIGKTHSRIFDAYILILNDPLLKDGVIKMITDEAVNAEYAVQTVIDRIVKTFASIDDEYFRERSMDIMDIGRRILKTLLGKERKILSDISESVVVVAHSLSPSDTISLKKNNVLAFATDIGGRTSHTAILAQSLEIPAVVGLKNATREIKPQDTVIVDGRAGVIIVNPDEGTVREYEKEREKYLGNAKELEKLRDMPAVTLDGHVVRLAANLEIPEEISSVLAHGAAGVGLYRTEYLYMDRNDFPSEEEQYASYREISEKLMPDYVIVRTLDLGADKFNSALDLTPEKNPFMGMRAIRFCLKHPDIFRIQLRAILRASAGGNLKIMFPMISGISEFRQSMRILESVKEELLGKKIPFNSDMEVGAMIETPSAALTADILAAEADFFSIGTNDLIQYTLAIDRGNENVTHLYEPLHISILRLIKRIIDEGHRAGIWVGMCGEMAADPTFTRILVGMKLDEFSMSPLSLPAIKKIIRSINMEEASLLADEVLSITSPEEIAKIIGKT